MSRRPVDVLLLWHFHQPDYRSPREGRALLPWVRLHATKDYLDMALRLERHPGVRAAINVVPSLVDQLEHAAGGGREALFDLLRLPVAALSPDERVEVAARCATAPRHALERWPRYRALAQRLARVRRDPAVIASDQELLAIETWFLLGWLDPLLHDRPEAAAALATGGEFTEQHRDRLIALSDAVCGEVVPALARLAARGQVELSTSPYYHPILPLVADLGAARRARPDLVLPAEPFAAPDDASLQVARALDRHAAVFGSRPAGMWPPEGGVSPEIAALAARAGVRWIASDEGVLWHSLPGDRRGRARLHQPWRVATPDGDVAVFFRDRELSDRIGFVYQHWDPRQAAHDLLERIRASAAAHEGPDVPLVSIMLDGENCWESYPDDGGPFLAALYAALESSDDVRTRTPAEALAARPEPSRLERLHTGSWIDADFHIWIGHAEKNRGWDLLARARRALVDAGATPESSPAAWEALLAAEGSDWFWWFGDDHYTADKPIFDRIFREHLQAAYERARLASPGGLQAPVAPHNPRRNLTYQPLGFLHPEIDGERSHYYEWYAAGRHRMTGGGGAMHRVPGLARKLYFGFDARAFYLRLDFEDDRLPGPDVDLALDWVSPRPARIVVRGLESGERTVLWRGEGGALGPMPDARCRLGRIFELAVPFAPLGLAVGESVEIAGQLARSGEPIESFPWDDLMRFTVPDGSYEDAMWTA